MLQADNCCMYGRYILPVKYKGKFLIKQFETKFRSLLHTEVKEGHSYEKIEDYFNI